VKTKAVYRFRKAWRWPNSVEDFISSKMEGHTLHVCCGRSEIGHVRIDLYERADIRADMFHLPIKRGSFDTVICDPPWELPYHKRHLLLYELRDCLKRGGKLILNSFWYPRLKGLKLIEFYVGIPEATWRNVSLLVIMRKIQAQLDEFEGE